MSEDMAAIQTAGSEETDSRRSKKAYIIPILLGATAWFALLGFGLDKIYSMAANQQDKPVEKQTQNVKPAPVENASLQQQAVSKPAVQARFAVQMQDDHLESYTVYLNAADETSSIQPSPLTVAALPGDKLVHGDYETAVQPAGGGDIRKQAVTMPGMTFNLNRRQVYVMAGNPQVLTVTQPGDWNGVNAHFYTLKSGTLTSVRIVRGQQTEDSLYMMAMKPLLPSRQFLSIDYNKANAHWVLITWQMDPDNTVLREIGQRDLSQAEVAQVSRSWTGVSARAGGHGDTPSPPAGSWQPAPPPRTYGNGGGSHTGGSSGGGGTSHGGGQVPPPAAPTPNPPPNGGVGGSLYSHPPGSDPGNDGGVGGSLYSQPSGSDPGNDGGGTTVGSLYGPPVVGCSNSAPTCPN